MGLNIKAFRYIQMFVHDLDREFTFSRICLLGNLYFARGTNCIQKRYGTKVVHKYFEKQGVDVVSIDLNGKDGALPLDLQKPLPEYIGTFDMIINAGTIEHVAKQQECLQNVHNICRKDGLMFHIMPYVGNWRGHGLYTYDKAFFKELALEYHYSVIDIRIDDYVGPGRNLIFACLKRE